MASLFAKYRRALLAVVVLILVSPVFGVVLADLVGYHEPLDIAAEELGLREAEVEWTPFADYTVPGLPDTVGYVVSGFLGVAVILSVGALVARVTRR